jgi:hypothetical protein
MFAIPAKAGVSNRRGLTSTMGFLWLARDML